MVRLFVLFGSCDFPVKYPLLQVVITQKAALCKFLDGRSAPGLQFCSKVLCFKPKTNKRGATVNLAGSIDAVLSIVVIPPDAVS